MRRRHETIEAYGSNPIAIVKQVANCSQIQSRYRNGQMRNTNHGISTNKQKQKTHCITLTIYYLTFQRKIEEGKANTANIVGHYVQVIIISLSAKSNAHKLRKQIENPVKGVPGRGVR